MDPTEDGHIDLMLPIGFWKKHEVDTLRMEVTPSDISCAATGLATPLFLDRSAAWPQ